MEAPAGSSGPMRTVQRLIWHVVKESLKDVEHDEVKRAVGSALIDENEALFQEAQALEEILGDVHTDTSALLKRRQLCSNIERNMIETEILLVMDKLRSCVASAVFSSSAAKDRDPESVLRKATTAQDEAVYDYLTTAPLTSQGLGSSLSQHRPSTASSRPPTASTLSRPSTASSSGSNASQLIDPSQLVKTMQAKLSIFCIDQVKQVLRGALQEEKAALLGDIEFLTAVLNDETELQAKVCAPVPSLNQLKAYSSKLRELVVAEESRLQHEHVVAKMFHAAQSEASKASKLRRMVSASRTSQTDSQIGSSKDNNIPALATRPSSGLPSLLPAVGGLGSRSSSRPMSHERSGALQDLSSERSVQGFSRPGSGTQTHEPQVLKLQDSTELDRSREARQEASQDGGVRRVGRSSSRTLQSIHAARAAGWSASDGSEQTAGLEDSVSRQGVTEVVAPASRKPLAGSLLDAQADLLKGGVAAILAKHNYQTTNKMHAANRAAEPE